MNALLLNSDYISNYYNCSGRTYEEWKAFGHPNVALGFMYFFLGIIFMIILLPFMVVFVKSDLMKYSCYKIMFFLGVVDCIQIPVGGLYCGYATAIGMVYCMAPTTNYILGGLASAIWCCGSATCMLLAVNRCIDLTNSELGQKLFNGKRTIIWLLIPITCFFYFFYFHTAIIFNTNVYAFLFDPFFGTPERNGSMDIEHYPHVGQIIYNFSVVVVLFVAYSSLLIYLWIKTAKSHDTVRMSKIQRQTFIQCTLVCSTTFIAAIVYVYMQFFPTPVWVVVCTEIAWHVSHGAAGISYAFFNTTMRNELLKIFCGKWKVTSSAGIMFNKKLAGSTNEYQFNMKY